MCGRYYVDEIVGKEIRELVQLIGARDSEKRIQRSGLQEEGQRQGISSRTLGERRRASQNTQEFVSEFPAEHHVSFQKIPVIGDVHPSEWAEIIYLNQESVEIRTMRWGFPGKDSGLIINARAETVLERPLFRESVRYRRCIVPAGRYYEWNRQKEKVAFERSDTPVFYMAGLYNLYQGEERFVVITTEANESVRVVHDRMPLILEPYEVELWLRDEAAAQKLLNKVPATLHRIQEYEQLSLWGMEE